VNFYKHHIGDYAKDTEHLSWDEDHAYTRLMRVYYRDERPLPLDLAKVARLARAHTASQKAAIETVLGEFFIKESDGWHNKRCDSEIAAASNQADTNRRIAEERERAKRSRNANESLNGSYHEQSTNRQPIQTPDSNIQTPLAIKEPEQSQSASPEKRAMPATRIPSDFALSDSMIAYAVSQGIDPQRTFENFCDYWKAASGAKARKHDWEATWRTWCRNEADRKRDSSAPKTKFDRAMEHLNRA
jgi:uncharacterized protein YdaU (DUF1376 family)